MKIWGVSSEDVVRRQLPLRPVDGGIQPYVLNVLVAGTNCDYLGLDSSTGILLTLNPTVNALTGYY
jgi:hypothetical protein